MHTVTVLIEGYIKAEVSLKTLVSFTDAPKIQMLTLLKSHV